MAKKREYHTRRTPITRTKEQEVAKLLEETWRGTSFYSSPEERWLAMATIVLDAAVSLVEVEADRKVQES